jgi:hypothetical protein
MLCGALFFLSSIPCAPREVHISPMSSPSSPPPSYSLRSEATSSASKKLSPASLPKDKDKNKNKDSDKQKTESRENEKETTRDGDDAISIHSKSSSVLSSGTTSSTQSALDTLRLIAGSGVHRSKCRAEFLEELAKGPDRLVALDKDVAERLSIIAGKEGIAFFRKFIGWVVIPFLCRPLLSIFSFVFLVWRFAFVAFPF